MRVAILRSGILLTLAALGASAATAQTELYFATGVDSNGRALAQSNADGHVLIESPQYPRGLWLHLVDETGDALAGIRVEYQSRPDSLVAIHCVDPAGGVQETLIWTRPDGTPLSLMLKPSDATDLPAGVGPFDWHIDSDAEFLLVPVAETRLIGWEAVTTFLQQRWQGKTGRVVVQIDTRTVLAVDLDHLESIEMLVYYLQDQASTSLGEINASTVQVLLDAQEFKSDLDSPEGVITLSTSFVLLLEDPNLEKWVLKALGRREGPITLSEAAALTKLSATGNDIHSLAGIEHLTALQWLHLGGNQIADITPLKQLTNLNSLALSHNQIVDLIPLKQLTNLNSLALDGNRIVDLIPLKQLTNLTRLELGYNQIVDIAPLNQSTQLTWLHLGGNQIADITPLKQLTNLNSLALDDNRIVDIASLKQLINLNTLVLASNQIFDLTPLNQLTQLTWLYLGYNRIVDIAPLNQLTNLNSLGLDGNQIADITPLKQSTNLTWLALGHNRIVDIAPLKQLTKLNSLALDGNQIVDITPLKQSTNLERLYLDGNQITDITSLKQSTNLKELLLHSNQIVDLTPLKPLTNLNFLALDYNQIVDLTPLKPLTNLTWLTMNNNRIEDLTPLVANRGLGSGDGVDLQGNPLSDQARKEHIPALKARGVNVTY